MSRIHVACNLRVIFDVELRLNRGFLSHVYPNKIYFYGIQEESFSKDIDSCSFVLIFD